MMVRRVKKFSFCGPVDLVQNEALLINMGWCHFYDEQKSVVTVFFYEMIIIDGQKFYMQQMFIDHKKRA